MLRFFYSLFLLVGILPCLTAQELPQLLGQPVDPSRYAGLTGSPLLFADWVKGDILAADGSRIEGVWMNYNGDTGCIEVKDGEGAVSLHPLRYLQASTVVDGDTVFFQRSFDPAQANRFVRVLHFGRRYVLIHDYRVYAETKDPNGMSTTSATTAVRKKVFYQLLQDGIEIGTFLKIKEKKILPLFGDERERAAQLLAAADLSLDDEKTLRYLLRELEKD